jgi:nucleotide-binding universal stress UspA family protein
MMKVDKILYAAHLALNTSKPFRDVMEIAKKFDAKLAILHVVEELSPGAVSMAQWVGGNKITDKHYEDFKKYSLERIDAMIRETCEKEFADDPACADRIAEIVVVVGYPADEILKKVDELGCDALIIGTTSRTGITNAFLGSVAERVLRRIRKPAIVLPST